MSINYINWNKLDDLEIVTELGRQLKQMRLDANISQSQMAGLSGIDRVTISKIENGRPGSILSWVQLLRALDKLDVLNGFGAETATSSSGYENAPEKQRLRASPARVQENQSPTSGISFEID
jgi:transcriptional regulator with XRE-family HTH domain